MKAATTWGAMVLSVLAVVSCPSAGPRRADEDPGATEADRVRAAVADLFEAYEREDVEAFLDLVDRDFASSDLSGNAYRYPDLPRALRDDFEAMDRIEFNVRVDPPLVRDSEGTAKVDLEWSVRFLAEPGRGERILRSQESVLNLARGEDGRWRLLSLAGAPLFGVANRAGGSRP